MANDQTSMSTDDRRSAPSSARSGQAGWFRFVFEDDRWEWSAELEQLYGYRPGAAVPTTELILSQQDCS